MRTPRRSGLAALTGLALAVAAPGCAGVRPPEARVRRGPGFDRPPVTMLATAATCNTAGVVTCMPGYQRAVETASRMSIEMAGYSLIDSERVNLELRHRHEVVSGDAIDADPGTTELTGATWDDATPDEQRALVRDLGVDGVLRTAITLGEAHGLSQSQTIMIAIEVTRLDDDALVWRSRCTVDSSTQDTIPLAIDRATQCALDAALLP